MLPSPFHWNGIGSLRGRGRVRACIRVRGGRGHGCKLDGIGCSCNAGAGVAWARRIVPMDVVVMALLVWEHVSEPESEIDRTRAGFLHARC